MTPTSSQLRHAGIHFPENAGGEHPSAEKIALMPGMRGAFLVCSPSARWHWETVAHVNHDAAKVWRGIPEQGKLPAQLGWNAGKVADQCLLHYDEQGHGPGEWFLPLNELQFPKESGADFPGYGVMAGHLGALRQVLRGRLPKTTGLMFPAWVPSDDGDHLDEWRAEAALWDALCLHCYGSVGTMYERYLSYRWAFPNVLLFVGEWNANHEGHDERAALQMWADVAAHDPFFLGATYYIWETNNEGEHDLSIYGNPDRLALFSDPPLAAVEPPPVIEPEPPPPPPEPEPTMPEPATVNPWEFWPADQIAAASGCPVDAVRDNHPRLVAQLALCGINDRDVQMAVIGTVAVETASTYAPVREAFWLDEAWRQENLRYYPWYGRGFVQLTWQSNYQTYSDRLDALWGDGAPDLIENPDNALDLDVAAAVLAMYFRDTKTIQGYGIVQAARVHDWEWVRRLVQGGAAGLDRLQAAVSALMGTPEPITEIDYAGDVPDEITLQRNSWSCAVRSLYVCLFEMAEKGLIQPVTYGDTGPRDVYEWLVPTFDDSSVGLHDHTGIGLVQALEAHGISATNAYPVSLQDVQAVAGRQAIMIGGDTWGHWVAVRGLESDGTLVLENPARGYKGISDQLRDSFASLGPFAMVTILGEQAPVEPDRPAPDLATLVGVAYHEDGVIVPALAGALAGKDWSQVDAALRFLRENNPD